jgi:hypothetical protein
MISDGNKAAVVRWIEEVWTNMQGVLHWHWEVCGMQKGSPGPADPDNGTSTAAIADQPVGRLSCHGLGSM